MLTTKTTTAGQEYASRELEDKKLSICIKYALDSGQCRTNY